MTTQPPTIAEASIEDFGIVSNEEDEDLITNTTPAPTSAELDIRVTPRQNRGKKLDKVPKKTVYPQPDFSVEVLEEPAAEPITTSHFGTAGWIPMTIDQVLEQKAKGQPREPKVLNKWYDNPYFVQPNEIPEDDDEDFQDLEHILEQTKDKLKPVVSIANDPEAFHKSVDNLATLAYATEAVDYTSSTETRYK